MEKIVKMTLRIPVELHAKLRQRARQEGKSLNTVIVETLERGLAIRAAAERREKFESGGMLSDPASVKLPERQEGG